MFEVSLFECMPNRIFEISVMAMFLFKKKKVYYSHYNKIFLIALYKQMRVLAETKQLLKVWKVTTDKMDQALLSLNIWKQLVSGFNYQLLNYHHKN